jgi:hypothetical protein
MEADPSGAWMDIAQSVDNDDEDSQQADTASAQPATNQQQREVELYRRENVQWERLNFAHCSLII